MPTRLWDVNVHTVFTRAVSALETPLGLSPFIDEWVDGSFQRMSSLCALPQAVHVTLALLIPLRVKRVNSSEFGWSLGVGSL